MKLVTKILEKFKRENIYRFIDIAQLNNITNCHSKLPWEIKYIFFTSLKFYSRGKVAYVLLPDLLSLYQNSKHSLQLLWCEKATDKSWNVEGYQISKLLQNWIPFSRQSAWNNSRTPTPTSPQWRFPTPRSRSAWSSARSWLKRREFSSCWSMTPTLTGWRLPSITRG